MKPTSMNFCCASSLSVVWRSGCHFKAYDKPMSKMNDTSNSATYEFLVRHPYLFLPDIIGFEFQDFKVILVRDGYGHYEGAEQNRVHEITYG